MSRFAYDNNDLIINKASIQTDHYFINFPEDRWLIKNVVTAVFLIECAITALGLYNLSSIALQTFSDLRTYRLRVFIEVAQIIPATIGQNVRFLWMHLMARLTRRTP